MTGRQKRLTHVVKGISMRRPCGRSGSLVLASTRSDHSSEHESRLTMKLLSMLGSVVVLASAAVAAGCNSSDSVNAVTQPSIKCGSTECPSRKDIGIEKITQCCTADNQCGLQFPGATKCLLPDAPGVLSRACGDFTTADKMLTLTGCCGANGCGK